MQFKNINARNFLSAIVSLYFFGADLTSAQEVITLKPPHSEEFSEDYFPESSQQDQQNGGVASVDLATDWELYMLRLVNRSRSDPAGEAGRIGSSVVDTRPAVPPLAYNILVRNSARNHTNWMHDNFGNINTDEAPDSFTHYETLDNLSTGTPAIGTPSYTGATLGARVSFAGFIWGSIGENILTSWSGNVYTIDRARIDSHHRGWWESSGHRNNMLGTSYMVFGFYVEARSFVPPRGGLAAPADNLLYATQNFGRALSTPRAHAFGLIYSDRDGNMTWTPRQEGDPLREGLGNLNFEVFPNGSSSLVASGSTISNGAFSVALANGVYDIVFSDFRLPSGQLRIEDAVIAGDVNRDLGDIVVSASNVLGILETNPPNGYIDPLEDQNAATSELLGTREVSIVFSSAVTNLSGGALTISNFERKYYRGGVTTPVEVSASLADLSGQAVSVSLVPGASGAGPYRLSFSPRLPLGAWTLITVKDVKDLGGNLISTSANRVVLGALPMDVSQDGRIFGDDINRWLLINNNLYDPAPLSKIQFIDQKRNGTIAGEDITRGMQLIHGIGTLRAWSGFELGARP